MRGVVVPDPGEDFTADPVELFFDLSYVFAFAQLVFFVSHHPTWADAGRSLLLLALVWITWSQFTWAANAVSGNARPVRVWFLGATVAAVPMGASIGSAWGAGGTTFAVSQAAILGMGLLTMVAGLPRGSEVRAAILRYAVPNGLAMLVLLVGSRFDGDVRVVVWGASLLGVLVGMARAGRESEWIVRGGHFAERHGLILIVALGEVVVASGLGAAEALGELGEGAASLPGASFLALGAGGLLAALLWHSYFDRVQQLFEHRVEAVEGADLGRYARDVWTLWHFPLIAGVIAVAAALEEVTLHPSDPLGTPHRTILAVGLGLVLLAQVGAVHRASGTFVVERPLAVVVVMAVVLTAGAVDGVVLVGLVDLLVLGLLLLEERHPRHAATATATPTTPTN